MHTSRRGCLCVLAAAGAGASGLIPESPRASAAGVGPPPAPRAGPATSSEPMPPDGRRQATNDRIPSGPVSYPPRAAGMHHAEPSPQDPEWEIAQLMASARHSAQGPAAWPAPAASASCQCVASARGGGPPLDRASAAASPRRAVGVWQEGSCAPPPAPARACPH